MTRLIQDLSSLCQVVPVNLCLLAAWKNAAWDRFVLLAQEVPTPCLPCLCVPNTLCSCWSLFLNRGVHLSPYTSEIADIRLEDLCSSLHTPASCDCSWQLQVSVYWNKLLEKCSVACFLWITYGLVCAGIFTLSLGGSQIEKGKGTVFEMLILWSRAALSQRFFTWALYMFILDLVELMSHLLEWGGVLQKQVASPSCWNTLSKCCKSRSASLPARSVIASVF